MLTLLKLNSVTLVTKPKKNPLQHNFWLDHHLTTRENKWSTHCVALTMSHVL